MTARNRYRSLRLLFKAHHIRSEADTAALGEPGHHACCLANAAEMRRRVWLYGETPKLRRQALEFHAMYLKNARQVRTP